MVSKSNLPRLFLKIVVLGCLVACCRRYGAEWVSEEGGVSFRLPNDPAWVQIKGPRAEAKLVFQRTDASASVAFILFDKRSEDRILNEEFVKEFEEGLYRKRYVTGPRLKVSGEFFTFKGRRAYKETSKRTNTEGTATETSILWLWDNRLCEVMTTKYEGDPFEDTVIKEFVDS